MSLIKNRKINQLIFKELSELFRIKSLELSCKDYIMISVISVQINNQLTSCKIYLSIYPDKYRDQIFIKLKNNTKIYRKYLGKKLGKILRIIPNLIFYLDISLNNLNLIKDKLYKINNISF